MKVFFRPLERISKVSSIRETEPSFAENGSWRIFGELGSLLSSDFSWTVLPLELYFSRKRKICFFTSYFFPIADLFLCYGYDIFSRVQYSCNLGTLLRKDALPTGLWWLEPGHFVQLELKKPINYFFLQSGKLHLDSNLGISSNDS